MYIFFFLFLSFFLSFFPIITATFSALLFFHSFLYGWFLFINLREITNSTKYYGKILPHESFPPQGINSTTSTSSSATSSADTGSSHRFLLSETTTTSSTASSTTSSAASSAASSASSSASSSAAGSHPGPSTSTPGWFTCQEFIDAGTQTLEDSTALHAGALIQSATTAVFVSGESFTLHAGANVTCSHHRIESFIIVTMLSFVPLLLTTFLLIPTFLRCVYIFFFLLLPVRYFIFFLFFFSLLCPYFF